MKILPDNIKNNIQRDDKRVSLIKNSFLNQPKYNPLNYYKDVASHDYFYALIILRHYIKVVSDYYFSVKEGAKNIDLFMLTTSVSSPMGPGSDSEPIVIKFGKLDAFLTDSAQFGFEPLLLNNLDKVYCYLPSMRNENPDHRHLNQFFHCEAEVACTLSDLIPSIENYIKILCESLLLMKNIVIKISKNHEKTVKVLNKIVRMHKFPRINFDEAVDILKKTGKKDLVNFTDYGRDITSKGEIELMKILKIDTPIWLENFDRDRVPFYQKPDPNNKNKVINADLLFPPLIKNSFGGEVVGSGQRQDSVEEIYESLSRQKIDSKSYEWYIDLRRLENYKTTSGFGMGIERFIAWALAKNNIRDVSLYPRLKNIKTFP